MPVAVVQCCGVLRPGEINHSTDIPRDNFVPGSKPMTVKKFFPMAGSSWDGWSPARIRAAEAEHSAWQLGAQKALEEESAAAAAKVKGPEPGATSKDIRVYTQLKNGQYKYWGVRDDDMAIEEFWVRYDPLNTRSQEDIQNAPASFVPTQPVSPSNSPAPLTSPAPRSGRSQKSPEINPKHRVRKSANVRPPMRMSARKSLASKLDARHPALDEQVRDVTKSSPEGRNSTAHPTAVAGSSKQVEQSRQGSGATNDTSIQPPRRPTGRGRPRKARSDVVDSIRPTAVDQHMPKTNYVTLSSPPKRKRGRPAKGNSLKERSGKQKRGASETKTKITTPKQKKGRSLAPSSHQMRTRAKGPVEHSQFN